MENAAPPCCQNCASIAALADEAVRLNRTMEKDALMMEITGEKEKVMEKNPEGYMPPGKRKKLIALIEKIGRTAKGHQSQNRALVIVSTH